MALRGALEGSAPILFELIAKWFGRHGGGSNIALMPVFAAAGLGASRYPTTSQRPDPAVSENS